MDKRGVFISHITEERATALLLKDLLQRTFSRDLPIFVSSDYESIGGGDVWFTTIVRGLKTSSVLIVLLSPDSLDRRWINFEAGVGAGAEATVIPVVVHGLERGDVGHPLSSLQIRSLESLEEVHALMNDVGNKTSYIPKAFIDAAPLIMFATQRMPGRGWIGVDWQGAFLAVDGPILKLPKIENQTYVDSMSAALKEGGFRSHLANRYHLGPSMAAGYKIVHITDKKTYRAELIQIDVILAAKPDSKP
jgi:hypothetical protein